MKQPAKPIFITTLIFLLPALNPALAQTTYDNYKGSKTSFGHPDIGGFWTNVTMTKLTRPEEFGSRLVYTEQEVAEIEGRARIEEVEAARPVDPNAPAEFRHDSSVALRPEFAAAGGATGFYDRVWLDPGSRIMRVGGEPRTAILTTPDGQSPEPKESAQSYLSRRPGRGYDSHETRPLGERCIIGFGRNGGPPMYANGFYNNNYQIVQTPDHVAILVEMIHDVRIVRLNSEHRTDGVRPWFGDSIGWWEDNTLVVETTHIPEAQAFYGAWLHLTVTERFTRVAANRLHYRFTVEDPTIWESSWGGEYEFSTLDGEIYEYACHEGNYALPGILKGARVEEEDE
ncbi:MAG: hypothetical protein WDZ30_05070 [Cellvibrionaceae bacterium]